MLGSDKSRGHCLEMICADFLAGASLESGDSKPLRLALDRLFGLLSSAEQREFLETMTTTFVNVYKRPRVGLHPEDYSLLHRSVLQRDGWRCQSCGSRAGLEVDYITPRSKLGHDVEQNLITLCCECHRLIHSK